jgi:hypothetical protein
MYCFDVLFAIRLSLDHRKSVLAAITIDCVTNGTDWTITVKERVLQVLAGTSLEMCSGDYNNNKQNLFHGRNNIICGTNCKLGVKRWRTKALDRVEWASIIRETERAVVYKKKCHKL